MWDYSNFSANTEVQIALRNQGFSFVSKQYNWEIIKEQHQAIDFVS